jgi:hypothetical protein
MVVSCARARYTFFRDRSTGSTVDAMAGSPPARWGRAALIDFSRFPKVHPQVHTQVAFLDTDIPNGIRYE